MGDGILKLNYLNEVLMIHDEILFKSSKNK